MYKCNPVTEYNKKAQHKKFERRETRVSMFMKLYSTGKIEQIPENKVQTLPDDPRSDEQMLDDEFCPSMATEPVEVMQAIEEKMDAYKQAIAELKEKSKAKQRYKNALSVVNNPASTAAQKFEAYKVLKELNV